MLEELVLIISVFSQVIFIELEELDYGEGQDFQCLEGFIVFGCSKENKVGYLGFIVVIYYVYSVFESQRIKRFLQIKNQRDLEELQKLVYFVIVFVFVFLFFKLEIF